jgi:NAD(P)-dependent dehydrogenase (short-subunit alcohol dehydrogenase family)
MATICITGSASGMGAATAHRLREREHRVVGVDLRDADVVADLSTSDGRRAAIAAVTTLAGDALDGLATFAGLGGLPTRAGAPVASVNYFGTVELLRGLRPLLAQGRAPSAVAVGSVSMTCQPDIPMALVDAYLNEDEAQVRALADEHGSLNAYPASKIALTRWVRRHATTADWIGAGIRLNVVVPGLMETPLTDEQRADPDLGPLMAGFPIPTGRAGDPEEVAALVDFLLGPESTFFCGSIITCDGGTEALLRPDAWPTPWTPSSP